MGSTRRPASSSPPCWPMTGGGLGFHRQPAQGVTSAIEGGDKRIAAAF